LRRAVTVMSGLGCCDVAAPVVIVDYDPRWPAIFDMHRARLAAALGALAERIEHVGSTAVPGLAAKPIIDRFRHDRPGHPVAACPASGFAGPNRAA
jgi:GrpB-like predicted nucleotidyltransferase (UPF0157 family)